MRRPVADRATVARDRVRRAGVDVAAGDRAVGADAGRGRVHPPAGGAGRPRRVRVARSRSPRATASRSSCPRPTASGRRPRSPPPSGATTPSGSTSWRCAPTTSSARAPSRWPSSTTSPSGGWTRTRVAELVGGVADGCRRGRCALIGGETAEHPGLMAADDFRPAGVLHRGRGADRLLDGSAARAGDAIVGLASSGLHSNGYSLVRALVADHGTSSCDEPYQARLRADARRRRERATAARGRARARRWRRWARSC